MVKGDRVQCTRATASHPIVGRSKKCTKTENSPFTDAFFDTIQSAPFEDGNFAITSHRLQDFNVSFEDAFLDSSKHSDAYDDAEDSICENEEYISSRQWTRTRIKALESKIGDLSFDGPTGGPISLTKEMLARAQVIAQVEAKFIIIKTECEKLLAVDQHAADERVALEKLENALFRADSCTEVRMTKRKLSVHDILKQTALYPPSRVAMSTSQMQTLRHNFTLFQRWKFSFENEPRLDDRSIVITGLPSICGRVARIEDFFELLAQMNHFKGGEIRPAFAKRILASQACRYAIMFGGKFLVDDVIANLIVDSTLACLLCIRCSRSCTMRSAHRKSFPVRILFHLRAWKVRRTMGTMIRSLTNNTLISSLPFYDKGRPSYH
ncbi:hypothetical protein ACHAXS_009822 [Conticribra weissflogii]